MNCPLFLSGIQLQISPRPYPYVRVPIVCTSDRASKMPAKRESRFKTKGEARLPADGAIFLKLGAKIHAFKTVMLMV